jgi:hypothetical protein
VDSHQQAIAHCHCILLCSNICILFNSIDDDNNNYKDDDDDYNNNKDNDNNDDNDDNDDDYNNDDNYNYNDNDHNNNKDDDDKIAVALVGGSCGTRSPIESLPSLLFSTMYSI